jgi:hypothetical protein
MRKIAIYVLPLLALSASACSSSKNKGDAGVDDLATKQDFTVAPADLLQTGDMAGFPAAPALGAQIDRIGRAGVNTALTDPFWDDGTQTAAGHHTKQDAYNAFSDPTTWATSKPDGTNTTLALFEGALGAYDSLNGTSNGTEGAADGCGDQLAYGALSNPTYTTLATVLADDQIYVNSASGTCSIYLAVEANVLGVTNTDCGGRTPNYNTIDITYTGFVVGAGLTTTIPGCITGSAACGVTNGVTSDPGVNKASAATFPFLGAAN